jgi:hypothetical protein
LLDPALRPKLKKDREKEPVLNMKDQVRGGANMGNKACALAKDLSSPEADPESLVNSKDRMSSRRLQLVRKVEPQLDSNDDQGDDELIAEISTNSVRTSSEWEAFQQIVDLFW